MGVDEKISSAAAGSATVNADNPWPGLLAYREAEQGYFQGRKPETEELFRLVMRERMAVLFGLSGLGKSSLLQAGLFPMLRREMVFPIYIRLDFSAPEPNLISQVKAAISREALAVQIELPPTQADETLWEYLHRRDNDFWNTRNRPVTPLLVFDQFEEVFTLGCQDANRVKATEAFVEQLADLSEGRPPARLKARLDGHPDEARAFTFSRHHYKILLSIREDFLPDLETLRPSMPALALNRFRLRRMTGEAAIRVVNQAQNLIDPDVAEEVVRFVAADRGRLPLADLEVEPALLSVVCRELNNKRLSLGEPQITAGLLEGNRGQVLVDFYERSVADLPHEVRCFIEDSLLTVSGFRDSVAVDNALNEPGVTRQAIDQLVERRLVRREDRGGIQRLELTHDLLCGVVRTSRDGRLQIEAAERDRKALLEAQEAEKRRRNQLRLYATVVLLIVTACTLLWAVWQWNKAEAAIDAEVKAKEEAEGQRVRAEKAVEMIQRSLLIRQAALSGQNESLEKLLSSLDRSTSIRFQVTATYLGYKDSQGRKTYRFELYPEPRTLPTGQDAVAFVTYLASHPTFQNTLMIAGPERQLRVSYNGWGCLNRIVALVEYKDPIKPPTVAEFDMCAYLKWSDG